MCWSFTASARAAVMPDPAPTMPKGKAVNAMFAGVAPRYDTANHLLSGGVDYYWRHRLARMVLRQAPRDVVDLATGSGDVAFVLHKHLPPATRITGMDFCQLMLDVAVAKKARHPGGESLHFTLGDCMNLPLGDACVDAITIAFGLRNFEDRARGLREMHRVLRPGGSAFILEFSQPYAWFRPFYYLYLKTLLPVFARLICGRRDAYDYLAGSIASFPPRETLAAEIGQAGFATVEATPLTLGIVAIHQAKRQE